MSRDDPKVRFTVNQPGMQAQPMDPGDFACDCGCEDEITDPTTDDLTFYASPWEPKAAGVQKGYLVLRYGDSAEAEVADMALLHDGDGRAVGQIEQDTWRHMTIVEGE
jgi:hypothetical protein